MMHRGEAGWGARDELICKLSTFESSNDNPNAVLAEIRINKCRLEVVMIAKLALTSDATSTSTRYFCNYSF